MEDLDYSLVPEEVWKKFVTWYGLEESSRAICRKVVEHGLYVKHCKVEVYLVEFKLALHPDVNAFQTKKFSRADTVGELIDGNATCVYVHVNLDPLYKVMIDCLCWVNVRGGALAPALYILEQSTLVVMLSHNPILISRINNGIIYS